MTVAVNQVRVDMGWTVHAVLGSGQHQIAVGADGGSGAAERYFGELNDSARGTMTPGSNPMTASTGTSSSPFRIIATD
jgi:hypothetical protein